MAEPLIPTQNLLYSTYLKKALMQALRPVFASHPDPFLRGVKVGPEYPFDEARFPAIVISFYERELKNVGVAHFELFPDPNAINRYQKYAHMMYSGDVQFAVYALSSKDRDLIGDTLVQMLLMGNIEAYTNQFLERIYNPDLINHPDAEGHMVNVNTDRITGMGESVAPAPWQPEDVLVYQKAYRVPVLGEVYSRTQPSVNWGIVDRIDIFPYNPANNEPVPNPPWAGPDGVYGTADDKPDPAPWES